MNGCDTHWALSEHESIRTRGDASTVFGSDMHLMVLLRVRNEELILQDSLAHLAGFADLIAVSH